MPGEALEPLDRLGWQSTFESVPVGGNFYRQFPKGSDVPPMMRWQDSYYLKDLQPRGGVPWHVILRVPLGHFQMQLYQGYTQNLGVTIVLLCLALVVAGLVRRQLTRPLARLEQVTKDLPEKIGTDQELDWPPGSYRELRALVSNFREMARKLHNQMMETLAHSEMLREQEARLQKVVDTMPVGICLVNAERHCTLANAFGEQCTEELAVVDERGRIRTIAGQSIEDVLEHLRGGQPETFSLDHTVYEISAHRVETGGEGDDYIIVIRDVTTERELEEKLRQQQHLSAIGELAGGIAHDFNNLLTVMMGTAEVLEADPGTPDHMKEDLASIRTQGERAAHLVRQILDFSRKSPSVRRPVQMVPFLREAEATLERILPENIRVVTHIDAPDSCASDASASQIGEVVTNLAINARDAMPHGGTLTLTLNQMSVADVRQVPVPDDSSVPWVSLEVADTGEGIPGDVLERIFEPFFTTKGPGEGTGLGLSQAYGIIKQHGGEIDVKSREGEGTSLTIYLPLLEQTGEEEPEGDRVPGGRSRKVLVAEDEEQVLQVARRFLERLNYDVLTASNGDEALRVYAEHQKDIAVVLTDLVMPDMTGSELLDSIRKVDPQVPFVMMTGYARDAGPVLQDPNVMGLLNKPFSIDDLARMMKEVAQSAVW